MKYHRSLVVFMCIPQMKPEFGAEMLRYICPAIVVQICITVQSKNLPDGVFWLDGWQAGPKMINIDAASHDASNRS